MGGLVKAYNVITSKWFSTPALPIILLNIFISKFENKLS